MELVNNLAYSVVRITMQDLKCAHYKQNITKNISIHNGNVHNRI